MRRFEGNLECQPCAGELVVLTLSADFKKDGPFSMHFCNKKDPPKKGDRVAGAPCRGGYMYVLKSKELLESKMNRGNSSCSQ